MGSATETDSADVKTPPLGSLRVIMQNGVKGPGSTLHIKLLHPHVWLSFLSSEMKKWVMNYRGRVDAHRGQRRIFSIFLCISLPNSLKTGSLTEHRAGLSARLVATRPVQPSVSTLAFMTILGYRHTRLLRECQSPAEMSMLKQQALWPTAPSLQPHILFLRDSESQKVLI